MTIEIHDPKLEAFIQQQMQSGAFRDTDELLSKAVNALQPPSPATRASDAKNLVELFKPVEGLLTDEEVDTLFARDPSPARDLDLS